MDAVQATLLCALALLLAVVLAHSLARACCGRRLPPLPAPRRLLAVLGSGGHTKELLSVLRALPAALASPRAYILADTDATSLPSALALGALAAGDAVHRIARAREVGQPALAAAWGTLRGFAHALRVVRAEQPRLLLVNGPGTCIPVCAAAVLLRALGLAPRDLAIVFVESVCRVDSLSVSGHAAYWLGLADVVAVQWRQLKERFPRAHYVGLQV
jgi:beta-1,4-N-acetylglucosaminyltransferase